MYDGNSYFTLTIKNNSGGTANETPLSPGSWSVSYIAGDALLNPTPIYAKGQPTFSRLTSFAEAGDNPGMTSYLAYNTGIFTPLSPVLVVIYTGNVNPVYVTGENDRGEGLKDLAQKGNADILAAALKNKPDVKAVYVLPAPTTKVLLPSVGGAPGGLVSQGLSVVPGDRLAIATMYGFSNDWFFTTMDNGVDATQAADISDMIALYDNGTAINQFRGAGIKQYNLAGTPLVESQKIAAVPKLNGFTTLPPVKNIIRVILTGK
ncbi:MAG: hypothetical protein EPO58_15680 [Chitinophagaceae bacterium]|nr:MAG: hypothetical protein EPO58_15680 [Chitinophagaceae bacterium]